MVTPVAGPPVPVRLSAVFAAWRRARRGKKPSQNQLRFEARWLSRLQQLTATLREGAWQPAPTVAFVVRHPKTREIHAPDFADRVVHHLLVERLEKLFEPRFIHDSFANRQGKGSHAAVARLQTFVRQRENMPAQRPACGWYLQLDIHNFFNTIHRPTLYGLLCHRLAQAQQRAELPAHHAQALRGLCHALLAHKLVQHERDPAAAASLPPHKRLCNAPPGRGVPVGNLTSQFFANVYLNELGACRAWGAESENRPQRAGFLPDSPAHSPAMGQEDGEKAAAAVDLQPALPKSDRLLDQFIKHQLKVRHYVRYVDDLVLLGSSAAQLQGWQAQIELFLKQHLGLSLRTGAVLQPCSQGIDFLGYRVFAHHRWVRPRVLRHCRAKLAQWQARHPGGFEHLSAAGFAQLQALLGSYWGHFAHANSVRLRQRLWQDFPWLADGFELLPCGRLRVSQPGRWLVRRHHRVRQILRGTPGADFFNPFDA